MPRIRKLRAAGPHARASQSRSAWKPPEAEDQAAALDAGFLSCDLGGDAFEAGAGDVDLRDFGLVGDGDAEVFGGVVIGVHQRLAATEEEGVGAAEREECRKGRGWKATP